MTLPFEETFGVIIVLDNWTVRHIQKHGALTYQFQEGLWEGARYIIAHEHLILGREWTNTFRLTLSDEELQSLYPPALGVIGYVFPGVRGEKFFVMHKEKWRAEGYPVDFFKDEGE